MNQADRGDQEAFRQFVAARRSALMRTSTQLWRQVPYG